MKEIHFQNNFDFVRLVAAIFVIIGHSIFILGINDVEFFGRLFGVHAIHGTAVHIFFALSGYLIAKSYVTKPNPKKFILNRCLRIFPALIFSTFITIIIIGLFYSTVDLNEFITQNFKYAFNIFLYFDYHKMCYVFEFTNDPNYVNRNLWTLKYEFSLYLMVLLLGLLKILRFNTLLNILFFLLSIYFFHAIYNHNCNETLKFLYIFSTGIMFYLYEMKFHINTKKLLIVLSVIFVFGRLMNVSEFRFNLLELLIPVIALCFSLQNYAFINNAARFGDFSYGIYLFGYPVQQAIYSTFKDGYLTENVYIFSIVSIFVTLLFAIISWHLVEKRFLRKKY